MARQFTSRPSALAGLWGECIAEFFGTLILLLFGDGCVATFALFTNIGANNAATPFANEWIVIILGWGLAVMLGIYVAGAISGAHLNPAVTLALAARGKLPWSKVVPYWVAQVLGGFVAAAILYFVYQGALVHALSLNHLTIGQIADPNGYGGVFYTAPKPFVGTFGAFCDEFVGTALLVGLIFAIVDGRNQPVQANLNPLIIGLLVVAIGASFGLNTGYAINPARDFGPRLWIALVSGGASLSANNYYFWIPIVAPLLGGVVGAFIYDFTVGKVLEARGLAKSGTAETKGEAVRVPSEAE
ncbi:MAG: MIP family channel protein [Thermogemmatispora sp.]|jgi:glycerol uptake facilitator protein|uniref:Aquaporin n=1 Tax=Thermogemmatispora aurantia TaxID=2045279 RepID=A0A5J4K5R4_9CHLR|nr:MULTISPECIES: MIP family channel protein [Thermogemmatispora]MBE3566838.1 MIP family channel protein [Thermogemmatispora sp.]GER83998.1 aquaporin [Thermogemmatispora aurantia]